MMISFSCLRQDEAFPQQVPSTKDFLSRVALKRTSEDGIIILWLLVVFPKSSNIFNNIHHIFIFAQLTLDSTIFARLSAIVSEEQDGALSLTLPTRN